MKIGIIGGGAAGFFAAINLKEMSPSVEVTILEAAARPLQKVGVSGGGRCNLTNTFTGGDSLSRLYPRGEKIVRRAFKIFNHSQAYQWFENRGVKLVKQQDNCVFPRSQDSGEIIQCFLNLAHQSGIHLKLQHRVISIIKIDQHFEVATTEGVFHFDRVVVTTGGSPVEDGYNFLRELPLEIIKPLPSLFTLNIPNSPLTPLMGIVVPDVIMGIAGTKIRSTGDLLITHWGLSGPAALRLSSYGARLLSERAYSTTILINWIGETALNEVTYEVEQLLQNNAKKMLSSLRPFNLTTRVWLHILSRCELSPERRCGELGSKSINAIVRILTSDEYAIKGKAKHKEEFVTCGGVSESSINLSTLEAKECEGLYFAGEVLDLDAVTGGYNLQGAWSTGYVVATNIANQLK